MKSAHTIIFAKAPMPGFAKTRLVPALGEQGAADLARVMLERTVEQALAASIGPVELCLTPGPNSECWARITLPRGVLVSFQGDGDLGMRLARAAVRTTAAGSAVLLIGTDCPELSAARLHGAARALRQHDCVMHPASDGGYVLLGLARAHWHLFSDIAWGTDTVAFSTLARVGELGWSVHVAERLHDVDNPGDLRWVPDSWLARADRYKPATIETTCSSSQ